MILLMFGNALGWALSILLVVAVVASVSYIDRTARPTPPDAFGLDARNAAPLRLPDVSSIAPRVAGREAEATALYGQALQLVAQNRAAFDAFNRADHSDTPEPVAEAGQLLIRATGLAGGSIFQHRPEALIHYRSETPELTDVERLGKASLRGAMIVRRVNPAAGLSQLRAGFVLGERLFEERITSAELNAGLQLLAESAATMKLFLRQNPAIVSDNTSNSPPRDISSNGEVSSAAMAIALPALAAVEAFDAERLALTKTVVLPIAGRIRTLDGPTISRNLGNVRRWATSPPGASTPTGATIPTTPTSAPSPGTPSGTPGDVGSSGDRVTHDNSAAVVDPVWRVESVLALGRARFGVGPTGTLGDQ
ncbi:MAG TPA: hypothetical protein PLD59_01165, partial [Tepidisphaeraceae bacterium]|nr:hypothetical protein [Tepidisphaeraceae bacterium]